MLSPTHTHTPGAYSSCHTRTLDQVLTRHHIVLDSLSLPCRVQAFIQQLVDTRPDMVTREVVGKTIVSDPTKV